MSKVSESGVLSHMIADHFPIYIVKKKERNDKQFVYSFGRSYKNYNKENFQNLIETNIKWRSFWNKTNDPNISWDLMLLIILEAINILCPIKRMRLRTNVPGWINTLHQIINYVKDKIGVVFLRSCVIFDTL